MFNPYGVAKGPNAGWILCRDLKRLKKTLKKVGGRPESFHFYNFEVTSIQKAPKELLLNYKMQQYETLTEKKKEEFGKYVFCNIIYKMVNIEHLKMYLKLSF